MLAVPMPPQASLRPPPSLSSSSSGADASASRSIMSPAIPHQPSTHPSTVSRPNNMSCGLTSSTNATASRPSALTRPKLTLQTSSLPVTFGSSTTGLSLSLAAGPTASPTVRNTFKNAYDVPYPSSATASPSKPSSNRFSKPSSPYPSSNPYQLPLGVKSILRNSPLESTSRLRSNSVAPRGPSGASGSRRVFFPTKKQVSYRYPLEEEIKTVKYTVRHSDIVSEPESYSCEPSSDEDSDYSTSSQLSSDTTPSDEDAESETPSSGSSNSTVEKKKKKKRKYHSAERQVRAVALLDGLKEDPYASRAPQTPRQGRLKRRCEWRWTLGPLDGIGEENPAESPQALAAPTSNTQTSSSPESDQETDRTKDVENEADTPASSTVKATPPTTSTPNPPSDNQKQIVASESEPIPAPREPDPPH